MKKIFAQILALTMLLSLMACGNGETEPTTPSEPTTPTVSTEASTDATETPAAPTQTPTQKPTTAPTEAPTEASTAAPTQQPTAASTQKPTAAPTQKPTAAPTEAPIVAPTQKPTATPTQKPTVAPTEKPTVAPTEPNITEPEIDYMAEYERILGDINRDYDQYALEIENEYMDLRYQLIVIQNEIEAQKHSIRVAWQKELNSLSQQKENLVREKNNALGNALANAGGQYSSYYYTLEKQYNDRIAAIDNQISQTNTKYNKEISELDDTLEELPTTEELEHWYVFQMQDLENWRAEQIQNLKDYYGVV